MDVITVTIFFTVIINQKLVLIAIKGFSIKTNQSGLNIIDAQAKNTISKLKHVQAAKMAICLREMAEMVVNSMDAAIIQKETADT